MKYFLAYGTKINAVFAVLGLIVVAAFSGCASNPTTGPNAPLYNAATQLVASVAVRETVERGNASPEVIKARASRIVGIASALQAVGNDELATLPAVTAALDKLLDDAGLNAHERIQADILVQALLATVNERVELGDHLATVRLVLDAVIRSAVAYLTS